MHRELYIGANTSLFMKKKYNRSIAETIPLSPIEPSGRRMLGWLILTYQFFFFFYHCHVYQVHITQKTKRVEVTTKKRAHNIVERAGTSHWLFQALGLNPNFPAAECTASYLSLWASLRHINVKIQWYLLPALLFILFIYQWRSHPSEFKYWYKNMFFHNQDTDA